MLKLDALNQLKQLKTDIKASRNLHKGSVKGTGQKFGFVTLDEGRDVFLPPDEMERVLPGDRVEVEVLKDDKNKTFAKLERLIESANKIFFGAYTIKGKAHFVEADIPGSPRWIFVPPQKRGKNKAGDLVKGKLTQHPFKNGKGQALVLEKLGTAEDQGIEWRYTLAKYGVSADWSKSAKAELEKLGEPVIQELAATREDFTHIPFVTIDGESTRDLDDAIYTETLESGWQLYIAVADPTSLLAESPELEKEAIQKASSVYTPGQVVPMLPKEISSDLASLVADKLRLAIVVKMDVAADGTIGESSIHLSKVQVSNKLSYNAVSDALAGQAFEDPSLQSNIVALSACASALRNARRDRHLVHDLKNEFYIELSEQQKIQAIHPKTQTEANSLVEECMVAANRVVAQFVMDKTTESVYVTHPGLREDRHVQIEKLVSELAPDLKGKQLTELDDFVSLIKAVKADGEQGDFANILTRQYARGALSSIAKPHFAMGLEVYTTFTSPLRKGNDYLLHKQLANLLQGREFNELSKRALLNLEEKQQLSRSAAFEIEQWLKCEYLEKSTETFTATVMRTFAGGLQLRLDDNGVEGVVNARELEGKYSFNLDLMILSGPAGTFKLEDKVQVTIKGVDWNRKQIRFDLVH